MKQKMPEEKNLFRLFLFITWKSVLNYYVDS